MKKLMPGIVSINSMQPSIGRNVYLWVYVKPLEWSINGKGVIVKIPEAPKITCLRICLGF
jgi:hypothetical protein